MKLQHLSEDKIHARNIGPRHILTRQPVQGKRKSGGQRAGEMERFCCCKGTLISLADGSSKRIENIKIGDIVNTANKYLKIKPRLSIFIKGLDGKIPDKINKIEGVELVEAKKDILFVTCESKIRSKVITTLEKDGYEIVDIKTIEPSLEDAFIKLIDKERGGN